MHLLKAYASIFVRYTGHPARAHAFDSVPNSPAAYNKNALLSETGYLPPAFPAMLWLASPGIANMLYFYPEMNRIKFFGYVMFLNIEAKIQPAGNTRIQTCPAQVLAAGIAVLQR